MKAHNVTPVLSDKSLKLFIYPRKRENKAYNLI